MRYSIITPTVVRPSLRSLCDSIDSQTDGDWEHLIAVDVPLILQPEKAAFINTISGDPRRKFFRCGKSHKNFGNTCRSNLCDKAQGDYILYLDDDDVYADAKVFEDLRQVTADWAIFPCTRMGEYWLKDPPGVLKTGSNMFMHRRGLVKYHDPDAPGYMNSLRQNTELWKQLVIEYPLIQQDGVHELIRYAADGLTVEELKSKYEYQVVTGRPLTVYEQANRGREKEN